MRASILCGLLALPAAVLAAAAGGPEEPVRVLNPGIDPTRHDGGLRPAVGVETIQVLRANREHPEHADGYGWTYNHASMLAYWQGRFYLEYLSNPFGENLAPGRTLLVESPDGRTWGKPKELFPILRVTPGSATSPEAGMATMHQDMGFYVAPNGRLLALAFYGHAPKTFGAAGIGRVVREIRADGSFGPIAFIRYAVLAGASEEKTRYFPFFERSPDEGFVEACRALLADKLKTMQWWGEDLAHDGFFAVTGHDSASVYHRADGTAVVLWKNSWAALSRDEGRTWSNPVRLPTLVTDAAKTWGQRTKDGRYAIVYVPIDDGSHRWPLAVATGADGIAYDQLLLVNGEIAPRRYYGRSKDFGLQYMRGICEGNGDPPGNDLWIAYENDKEDIWISRIPLPITGAVNAPVADDFSAVAPGAAVPGWNIRRGRWTPVAVVPFPDASRHSLQLEDRDPDDEASAFRVFPAGEKVRVSFRLYAHQASGRLDIELIDGHGRRPVRLQLRPGGRLCVEAGADSNSKEKSRLEPASALRAVGQYPASAWMDVELEANATTQTFGLKVNDHALLDSAPFAERSESLQRLSFRTGPYRSQPTRLADRYADPDLPNAGEPVQPATYNITDVHAGL
jgi:hypothetical protein